MNSIADIVAEMRTYDPTSEGDGLRMFADRIEEAWKIAEIELREDKAKMLLKEYAAAPDDTLTPSALELKRELLALAPKAGNTAKMREALVKTLDKLQEVTVAEKCDAFLIDDCMRYIRKALAAPPRNCDRLRTAKDAETAFNAMCAQKRTGKCTPLDCPVPSHTGAESCEVAWLFAPAEGGAE